MKRHKFFAGAIGAFILLCIPSCGQDAPAEESALANHIPAKGRIEEIILDGTSNRQPVSASISSENGAVSFQISDKTLFLDSQTGKRLSASDLLEAHDACIYAAEGSQPQYAEAVLLHISDDAPPAQFHAVEDVSVTEDSICIITDSGSLHLFAPQNAALAFYADGSTATPESIQPGDKVFAWYDSIEETYPAQTSTERLVIVPVLPSLPETLPDGISFSILPGSVTPEGASFRLFHNTNANLQYGSDFELQKQTDEEWIDLPYAIENGAFTMEAYHLPKGEPFTLSISWGWLYGELSPGKYRLVKTVTDFHGTGDFDTYPLTAEFTVGNYIVCR